MKQTLYSRTKEKVKNNWSSILVTTGVALCTAMVLFARCGGGGPMTEGPIRGDGVGEQSECYPYEMGRDRTFKKDENGHYILNKNYSPEDCHAGDGVLQTADNMKDMAGNPITLLPRFKGKEDTIGFPEGPDSIDARLSVVRGKDTACIPGVPGPETKMINRPLIKANPGEEIIRPMDEWEQMVRNPSSLPPTIYNLSMGRNSFKRPWLLEETCDTDLKVPDCAPNVNERCYCANYTLCPARVPPPPPKPTAKCNNKKWEKEFGEPCDSTDKKALRGGCDVGHHCTNTCGCVRDSEGPKCGNFKVEEGEDCDPPGSACTTEDAAGTCNRSCVCEKKPEPKVESSSICNQKILATLSRRIGGAVQGSAGDIRTKLSKGTSDEVKVSVGVKVDSMAKATILSITAEGVDLMSVVPIDLTGVPVPTPEQECTGTIPVRISAE